MTHEERRTGRTTKLITAALEKAKEGKHVIFYVGTTSMIWYARHMAQEILGAQISMLGKSEAFPESGRFAVLRWVSFEAQHRYRLGRTGLHVAFDHYLP